MEEPSPPARLHPDLRSGYRRTLLGALLVFHALSAAAPTGEATLRIQA